jgi:hypothetical protein
LSDDSIINESPRRNCGAMIVYQAQLETVPGFRERQEALNLLSGDIAAGRAARRTGPVEVPVVVHVVYNRAVENITEAQIRSQIDVLNEDFGATNADLAGVPPAWAPLIGDAQIRFALASRDPEGNPTTGITRTHTGVAGFVQAGNPVKRSAKGGVDPWDPTRYLNVWVCNLLDGLLGYAQFPGGPEETDGVVVLYSAFGRGGSAVAPFDRGRTATHEIGHYFNLFHIWGDTLDCSGSDYVDDTPNAGKPNYGKPAFPHVSCGNGPDGDMFMNYMDYVDDAAMFFFTQGQVERMRATLSGPRSLLGQVAVEA